MAWAAAANTVAERAAHGIAQRFQLGSAAPLMSGAFVLFLVVVGFRMLDAIATRGRFRGEALALPRRATSVREWMVGAALGWGLCLVAVLPMLLTGHLHGRLGLADGGASAIGMALATLLVVTLGSEVVFRGYPFRRLAAVVGPSWAAILLSMLFAVLIVEANPPRNAVLGLIDCTLLGLLLSMAWMRTHALWLGWGMHFAYRAVAAVALGLPIAGRGEFGSPTDMYATGPRWLTGGAFGLDAAFLTALVLLGGMIVLYRVTRDYAWLYTHAPIVAAGDEATVAPPAAHVAMERAASAPPPLVQILPSTPQTRSVTTAPNDAPPAF